MVEIWLTPNFPLKGTHEAKITPKNRNKKRAQGIPTPTSL
jgi:hypothetical protein